MIQYEPAFLGIAQIAAAYIGFSALMITMCSHSAVLFRWYQVFLHLNLLVIICSLLPIVTFELRFSTALAMEMCSLVYLVMLWSAILFGLYMARKLRLSFKRWIGSYFNAFLIWGVDGLAQIPAWLILFGVITSSTAYVYLSVMTLHLFQATAIFVRLFMILKMERDAKRYLDK